MFKPNDIRDIQDTMCKLRRGNSAQACAVLESLACCVGFDDPDTEKAIDFWCGYIVNLSGDLCQNDLGTVFRFAAHFYNRQADNLRDESTSMSVYR